MKWKKVLSICAVTFFVLSIKAQVFANTEENVNTEDAMIENKVEESVSKDEIISHQEESSIENIESEEEKKEEVSVEEESASGDEISLSEARPNLPKEIVLEENAYYYYENGKRALGWRKIENQWYYFEGEGKMVSEGWRFLNGWYYFWNTPERFGRMAADEEVQDKGKIYRLSKGGAMVSGWQKINGKWYYYNQPSGDKQVGEWKKINGIWYAFESNGEMLENKWKDYNGRKYYLHGNGAMALDWTKLQADWYYFEGGGAMVEGWRKIGPIDWYYFYPRNNQEGRPHGSMARNTVIGGSVVSPSGAHNQAYQHAHRVLEARGRNLWSAFSYSSTLRYQTMIANPSPGSHDFALHAFQNGQGNCYALAGSFYYMAKLLGYEAYHMTGYVPLARGGLNPHSWCEVVINGRTYVFDPDFALETGRNGYQIHYGASGTWRYVHYRRM